jgi:hypothetical protein
LNIVKHLFYRVIVEIVELREEDGYVLVRTG